jgi:hypothetical protein
MFMVRWATTAHANDRWAAIFTLAADALIGVLEVILYHMCFSGRLNDIVLIEPADAVVPALREL